MKKSLFELYAEYNNMANQKMDAIIKTLAANEWEKDLGGYFKSVRGVCSHIYICDFNWLKRFSKLRDFKVMKQPSMSREPYSFSEVLFENMNEYLEQRPILDEKMTAFAKELGEDDFKAQLKYTDSHGTVYEKNFSGLVIHCFNHETHHRGMISLYLELLGKENDFNSLNAVL
ncbi:MAG: DinB family protein [Treponema sp.]|nr:DinB family protein [Treponema sp.]